MTREVERLAEIIAQGNVVFFGGAGVSTESGIPDFRSEAGLYAALEEYAHSPEELLSHTYLMRNSTLFFQYYKKNLVAREAKPNKAHIALAELEQRGLLTAVVTQNIDGLHQSAGSRNVFELHGSNFRHFCMKCREKYSLDYVMDSAEIVPVCDKCGGMVRPDVVLYEESLDDAVVRGAVNAISAADTLIVGGTSLSVYPAAGLLRYFDGQNIVLINKGETQIDNSADLVIREAIGETLGAVMELLT